jgi:hypothetical protein
LISGLSELKPVIFDLEVPPINIDTEAAARFAASLRQPALFVSTGEREKTLTRYNVLTAEPLAILRSEDPSGGIELSIVGKPAPARCFASFKAAAESALSLLGGLESSRSWPEADAPFTGGLAG